MLYEDEIKTDIFNDDEGWGSEDTDTNTDTDDETLDGDDEELDTEETKDDDLGGIEEEETE